MTKGNLENMYFKTDKCKRKANKYQNIYTFSVPSELCVANFFFCFGKSMVVLRIYQPIKRKCIISKNYKTLTTSVVSEKLMLNDLESKLCGWMSSMVFYLLILMVLH